MMDQTRHMDMDAWALSPLPKHRDDSRGAPQESCTHKDNCKKSSGFDPIGAHCCARRRAIECSAQPGAAASSVPGGQLLSLLLSSGRRLLVVVGPARPLRLGPPAPRPSSKRLRPQRASPRAPAAGRSLRRAAAAQPARQARQAQGGRGVAQRARPAPGGRGVARWPAGPAALPAVPAAASWHPPACHPA